jgi:hypothetical protein
MMDIIEKGVVLGLVEDQKEWFFDCRMEGMRNRVYYWVDFEMRWAG